MPSIDEATDDLFHICDVLQQDPTDDRLTDLAFRLSNFLEDLQRLHIDTASSVPIRMLSCPMTIPIMHREKLKAANAAHTGPGFFIGIEERETLCMTYLDVPRWRGWERSGMIKRIDELARVHGLRCVDTGIIPQD